MVRSRVNTLIVEELASRYRGIRNCMVVNYQGVDALHANELRKGLREKKINLEVVKDTLANLAFKEIGSVEAVGFFSGPSAIVSGTDDPVALVRTLVEWTKKVPALKIKGGLLEGRAISSQEVEKLSKLPPRPVLYAQIATLLKAPVSRLATILAAPLQNLRGALEAVKDKKEKESSSKPETASKPETGG